MRIATIILALAFCGPLSSAVFDYPRIEYNLIGYLQTVEAKTEDTLLDIARHNGIGQEEILIANPEVDRWIPGRGTRVLVPSRYVLPDTPRDGLVLNLPEMRLYYFLQGSENQSPQVYTYPVSIGRMDWETPQGSTRIVSKQENPSWTPPESIRQEHAADGDPLPRVVPPGPDNPLGRHAIRLNIPSYLIHGTNKPFGVGMRVSHGCIRMLPEDIEELFQLVDTTTPVYIINQPIKAGWYGGDLFLEIHPALDEYPMDAEAIENEAFSVLEKALSQREAVIDDAALKKAISQKSGIPVIISKEL
jgi:L,D-transpeptidase ErfK/SrfK